MDTRAIEALEELIDAKIHLALATHGGAYAKEKVIKSLEERVYATSAKLWNVTNLGRE